MRAMLATMMMLLMTTAALAGCAGSDITQEDVDAAREEGRAAGIAEATPVSTLDTIIARGSMKCGVKESQYGMGYLDAGTGVRSGLDISYCRGVAAALGLNPDTDIEYIPASGSDRFDKLASGTIDVLIRTTTWTTSRDADLNADFAGMNFFDGQGILVREDVFPAAAAGNSASGLNGANICVGIGSVWEAELVGTFSAYGIAFTSVPVADLAEASAKFIDGSCDAIAGEREYLVQRKASMDGDDSMGGVDIWITNSVGDASGGAEDYSSAAGWSVLNLTIEQDYGASSYLLAAHGEITLTGSCIANCTGQSAVIYHTYVFSTESFSLSPNYTTSSGGIDYETACEGMTNLDSWPGYFGPPGLECELDITMYASLNSVYWWEYEFSSFNDYEFTWSDWSYYVLWQSTPVTMHE